MIIANNKPIIIIGYRESSMTHEFVNAISKTHMPTVVEPQEYLCLKNLDAYQYIVSSWLDLEERQKIIDHVDQNCLDLVTYVDDSVQIGSMPPSKIESGSFVFPFCNLGIASEIGRHSIICAYSMIGHYSKIGKGCILRPGVIIVGKSQIGDCCVLNVRSTVTNQAVVCDRVEILGFSAVTKNIELPGQYVGTPARRIKTE
jgi:NDP-sugar pyrophosphorylase family protein